MSDNVEQPASGEGGRSWGRLRAVPLGRVRFAMGVTLLGVTALLAAVLGWTKLRQFSPAALALLAGLSGMGWTVVMLVMAERQRRRWERPMDQLLETLRRVEAGEAAAEELSHVEGPLGAVAKETQQLVRELRRQKAELHRLEREMGQRVAQRTDALERTIASLRHQASRDPLTGLYNRRMLDQHLPSLVERATRTREPLCLLMLDLDHFKVLNDTLGHAAGDDFLRTVGQLIRSSLREDDLAFRYGGDEFAVVMPGANEEAGRRLARRMTYLVDGVARTVRVGKRLGVSCGVAVMGSGAGTWEALLEAADGDLYETKGRRKGEGGGAKRPATWRAMEGVE